MSNQQNSNPAHDEVLELLPWYRNNTLEQEKRAAVVHHLNHCEECRHELEFLASMSELVQSDAEHQYTHQADLEKSLAGVMNRIEVDADQVNTTASWSSRIMRKLESLLPFAIEMPEARWVATAVAGLLVVVLAIQIQGPQPEDAYSVLSSSDAGDSLMRFSVTATSAAVVDQVRSAIGQEVAETGLQASIEMQTDRVLLVMFDGAVGVEPLNDIITELERQVQIESVEILP